MREMRRVRFAISRFQKGSDGASVTLTRSPYFLSAFSFGDKVQQRLAAACCATIVVTLVGLRRGGALAPFPEAPCQTGRADFPHPAYR